MNPYTVSRHLRPHQADILPRPPEWTELALCAEIDAEFFFPEDGQNSGHITAVCRSCEARPDCLRYVLAHPSEGVWGGFSEWSRNHGVARDYAAGKSLEDIIAEDDASYYERTDARQKRSAALAAAARERQNARERSKRAAAKDQQSQRTAA